MTEDNLPQFAEDEDSARARAFWKSHGKPIIAGVVIGLGGIVAFNYWQGYEQNEGEQASFLFERLKSGENNTNAEVVANELKEKYRSSAYTELATLSMAKRFVENNDLESAVRELRWVIDNSENSGFQHIARLRLAVVMLAQAESDKVLSLLLATPDNGSFQARYYELTADAYAQRNQSGDAERARTEYQKSIEALPASSTYIRLLQLKRDNIGNVQ